MSKPIDITKHGKLMSPKQASTYLLDHYGVRRGPSRLAQLRQVGGGPRFIKMGRDVYYSRMLLDTWIQTEARILTHSL